MRKKGQFLLAFSTILLLSIILISQFALAQERKEDRFFQANKFYSQSEYQKAASHYEGIITSGVRAGNIYYNLGNAYFKLGQRGKAILNYERALKLIPQDEDLSANLKFVRSTLEEIQPEKNLGWFKKIYVSFRDIMPANAWSGVLFANYLILFFVIIIAIFITEFRKITRYLLPLLFILTVLSFTFMMGKIRDAELNKEGVIIAEEVEVRYSPSFNGAVAFKLHEGIKVSIIRCEDDWYQIRLSRDKSGWVEGKMMEEI